MSAPRSADRRILSARPSGLTLIETSVSLAILAILAAAVGASILLASKAIPSSSAPTQSSLRAAAQAERILSELRYSLSFEVAQSNCVEFALNDRDADGQPETIRYEWSGVPGASLMRSQNGSAPEGVLTGVQQFQLTYHLKAIPTTVPVGNESQETVLLKNTGTTHLTDYTIRDDRYAGQYLRPNLPVGTVSWKVTRIKFRARASGPTSGLTEVQLYRATPGGLPSSVLLEEHLLREDALSIGYLWVEFAFTNASGLDPAQGVCLVLRHVSGAEACKVQYQDSGADTTKTVLLKSTNQGVTWSSQPGQSLLFYLYGTITSSGAPAAWQTYFVPRISLTLQVGSEPGSTVCGSTQVLNCPETVGL